MFTSHLFILLYGVPLGLLLFRSYPNTLSKENVQYFSKLPFFCYKTNGMTKLEYFFYYLLENYNHILLII